MRPAGTLNTLSYNKYRDAYCFPFVTLSPDGEVLAPVQSPRRRFGRGLGGIAPGRDGNDAILLLHRGSR